MTISSLIVPIILTAVIWGWTASVFQRFRPFAGQYESSLGSSALFATLVIWVGYFGGWFVAHVVARLPDLALVKIGEFSAAVANITVG